MTQALIPGVPASKVGGIMENHSSLWAISSLSHHLVLMIIDHWRDEYS